MTGGRGFVVYSNSDNRILHHTAGEYTLIVFFLFNLLISVCEGELTLRSHSGMDGREGARLGSSRTHQNPCGLFFKLTTM